MTNYRSKKEEFCRTLESSAGKVQQISEGFCKPIGITVFAYARVYDDGRASWVTSNAEQDLFLLESQSLDNDPLLSTKETLPEGAQLWFPHRKFPGSDVFYKERAKRFRMDHGMVLVKHQKEYLETCCFSGSINLKPLYNIFINEKVLFSTFMGYFKEQLDPRLKGILEEGIPLTDIKKCNAVNENEVSIDRTALLQACGWKSLTTLSIREKECLVLFRKGYTCQAIGKELHLSVRTVEHYMDSIKNKLDLVTRPELYEAAEKLVSG